MASVLIERMNTVAPHRRLGHRQMAFVRCWAEGLDLAAAWNRYLYVDGSADARRARGELVRLLDMLRALARVHGRPEIAALLGRDPEAVVEHASARPTLDEYRDRLPPDFYGEAELIARYQAEFGTVDARSAARRRQRLRERLVLALQWLERLEARDPQPGDPVAAWFDDKLAARLGAAGIDRLDALCARIARLGPNWHRGVPRIGPEGADGLQRELRAHATTLSSDLETARRP